MIASRTRWNYRPGLTLFASALMTGMLGLGCERETSTEVAETSKAGDDALDDQRGGSDTPRGVQAARAVHQMKTVADHEPPEATSELNPVPGLTAPVDGQARLWPTEEGVKLVLEVSHAPVGSRGVHVLAARDCDNLSQDRGAHFAPEGDLHALPGEADAKRRHLGDLGNIMIGADGKGRLEIELPRASLESGHPQSLVGKPLVLSSGQDHGQSRQPRGDSGVPIACGVIRERRGT